MLSTIGSCTSGARRLLACCAVASSLLIGVAHAATNRAPTISGSPLSTVKVGSWYKFVPSASDSDGGPQSLRYSVANKPSWATFSIYSGTIAGSPTVPGTWSNIRITVTDGAATATLAGFSITAAGTSTTTTATNRAPVISGSPGTTATAGTAYSFQPTASDADGNTLGYSIQNRPAWATFSTATGRLSGTPTAAYLGTTSNVVISVSDGKVSTSLPAFALTVRAATNAAPVISGTPATSVAAGAVYAFTPNATDANGDALAFSIQNRPIWASFDAATGRLSGTPTSTQAGSYANIIVSVSDGKVSAPLPAFAITVTSAVASLAPGTAQLSWEPPTIREDGSVLTNLAGYRIHYGTNANSLYLSVQLNNPGLTTHVLQNLAAGTYYFAVRAFDATGNDSTLSNVRSTLVK